MTKSSAEIREAFLEYFRSKGHQPVASSPLIPHNDPTLLFTNAGMNQFKDLFLGKEKRAYSRAASSQCCVRAGGKHNDLENVGYTARHHTFFEMLGNFSFGDYFKHDAIRFAWEFLTSEQWLNLPKERLWVTVYASDDEAYAIWNEEIGIPAERLVRIGDNKGAPYASDNFWAMGDTGPCGPCTEIFYDHGDHIWGGPPGSPEEDGDRYIEIWNLVFMQFNRHADGTMEPLPKPSVDTGMGLERISAVMQHVHSNYETDTFQRLIGDAARLLGRSDLENQSLRVIADHIRSCGFLIADGAMPSNEGRGYVLRRIIRRAIRHGHKLGAREPFFHCLAASLADEMGGAYDQLNTQLPVIQRVLQVEEDQFARTLERGLAILDDALKGIDGTVIPGELVFRLYDTYGFPMDLTADIARERGLSVDEAGFNSEMGKQRERAKQASNFGVDYNTQLKVECSSQFTGYWELSRNAKVVALFTIDGLPVERISAGSEGLVVLDDTPFYAESGGQVGDIGVLSMSDGQFQVSDTLKSGSAIVHKGHVAFGEIHVGESLTAEVDVGRRQAIALNHSATHLLHAALRQVLGSHVTQKGSQVGPERLRFDFSHFEAVPAPVLRQLEQIVNAQIRANHEVLTDLMNVDDARAAGAMALFGERYDDEVRVLSMGSFSKELCGGTHASRTGDIGFFKIVSEGGIAAGIRRIEAVTGQGALDLMHAIGEQVDAAAELLKGDGFSLAERVRAIADRQKSLERENEQLRSKLIALESAGWINEAAPIKGIQVLVKQLDGADPKGLRDMVDQLKNRIGSGVVFLATVRDDKISLIAGVTKDLTSRISAGDLVGHVAKQVGGKGGGRPDLAQAGGQDLAALPSALAGITVFIEQHL
ncbi:MAG: alanine--tRNA ligase [Gammaproteobacteria bacterium]|nr:alanine--tRNA ligase [Gammaproteobacteria bacterium]